MNFNIGDEVLVREGVGQLGLKDIVGVVVMLHPDPALDEFVGIRFYDDIRGHNLDEDFGDGNSWWVQIFNCEAIGPVSLENE